MSDSCNIFGALFDLPGADLFEYGPLNDIFGACTASTTGTLMYYGDYRFQPVPIITINKEYTKSDNQINFGSNTVYTFNGYILDTTGGGLAGVIDKTTALKEALKLDGQYFSLLLDGNYLLEGHPRIIGDIKLDQSQDNWTSSVPYSFQLEFDNEPTDYNITGSGEDTAYFPPFLQSVEENWSVSFDEQYVKHSKTTDSGLDVNPILMRVQHNVGAVGKSHYDGNVVSGVLDNYAYNQAKSYVNNNLGFDYSKVFPNMSVASASGMFACYDYGRVVNTSVSEGKYNVVESWAVLETGHAGIARKATENFTVDIRGGNQQDYNTVTIQGTIQGLEDRSYNGGFSIANSKFTNASGYWGSIKDGLFIYPRVQSLATGEGITLNPAPVTKTVTKSPSQGTINYSYEYNDRPSNCLTGAKTEDISIQDDYPSDVYNQVLMIGRPQGPVFQNLNTVTSFKRQLNINVIMSGRPGCAYSFDYSPRLQVASNIICPIYSGLSGAYSTVVKSNDIESWDPKTGKYSRNIGWVATDCNTAPTTSVC